MRSLKVFDFIEELDCFVVNSEYRKVADELGLTEWHPAVWVGRLFMLDNDYGEHWFDNWDLREQKEAQAAELGIRYDELMIIDPDRMKNEVDGPCHSPEIRKRFWTDVLKSLRLDYDLLFDVARENNKRAKRSDIQLDGQLDLYIEDLEVRIARIKSALKIEA